MSGRNQVHALVPPGSPAAYQRSAASRRSQARRRRRRLQGLARLLLLVIVVAGVVFVGVRVAGAASPLGQYEVRSGDTLWSIAQQSYGSGRDLRPVVFAIERANHLAAADLQPGDELVLPPLD